MKILLFFVALFVCSINHAEESIQQCKIAIGAEASQITGDSTIRAIRHCSIASTPEHTIYRLSNVWRTPQGVCHFLEENDPYVRDRKYQPVPAELAVWRHAAERYTLYNSFSSECGAQNSPEYFPTVALISEDVIGEIRLMWRSLNASDEAFLAFSRRFDAMTGGAAKNWRRNNIQIRFLDLVEVEQPWWRKLFGAAKKSYVLGLRDGCCTLFMAKIDVDDYPVIQSVLPSTL